MTAGTLVANLAELGISSERKSIYRDIETLRQGGLDIIKTGNGYYVGKRDFDLEEVKMMRDAVITAPFISPIETQQLTEKLRDLCSVYQAQDLDRMACAINLAKTLEEKMVGLVKIIEEAIAAKKQIELKYTGNELEESAQQECVFNPYALLWRNDRYYLIGNVEGAFDLTHFELSKIDSIAALESDVRPHMQVSKYPNEFDAEDYALRHLTTFHGLPVRVRMRCVNSTYPRLKDTFGRGMQIEREGATFIATVEAAPSNELIGFLAQFGSDLEILSPSPLRAQMREHMLQGAKLYTIC